MRSCFVLVWIATTTLLAGGHAEAAAGSLLGQVAMDRRPFEGSALELAYGLSFTPAAQVGVGDPILFLLGAPSRGEARGRQTLFCGRGAYRLPIPADRLSTAYFQDLEVTRYLMGPDYRLALSGRAPFTYRASREGPIGRIESDITLRTYEWPLVPDRALARAVGLLQPRPGLVRVVWQQMRGLNGYFSRAFLLALIYRDRTTGRADVEVYSASLLEDEAFLLLPDSVRNSFADSTAAEDLIGYAQRLASGRTSPP